jgi:hypothetical protein
VSQQLLCGGRQQPTFSGDAPQFGKYSFFGDWFGYFIHSFHALGQNHRTFTYNPNMALGNPVRQHLYCFGHITKVQLYL